MQRGIHRCIRVLETRWEQSQVTVPCYLISGSLNAVIDTGPPQGEIDTFSSELSANGLALGDIDYILNTHGHSDHIGGNAAIKAAGHAQLMIHKNDAIFLENQQLCYEKYFAPLMKALGRVENIEEDKKAFLKELGPPQVIDRYLQNGDLIELGDGLELQVIHLPGHTAGSVAYYWEKHGILFSGDSIQGLGSQGGMLPLIYDMVAYEKSLLRLIEMPITCLLSNHPYRSFNGAPSLIRQGNEANRFLHDSLEFVLRFKEVISDLEMKELDRFPGSADKIVAALPAEMGFKSIAETRIPLFSLTTIFWILFRRYYENGVR
jgi:glyoxylase-like metal-dependent hydrolase (beta-lactamase superfamily II)